MQQSEQDLIVMGSNTVDAFATAESDFIEIKSNHSDEELIAYPLGSKIVIKDLRFGVGGNGVNVSIGCSRMGVRTAYLGKVGLDSNGELVLKALRDEGVSFIGSRGGTTGFSMILESEIAKDHTILTFKGANNDLRREELPELKARYFYFTSMLGDSFNTMKQLFNEVKDSSFVAFNPSKTLTVMGVDSLKELLEAADLLILNEEEAEDLVGQGSPEEKALRLLNFSKTVVVTLGAEGLVASDGSALYKAGVNPEVKVVETTGAGDSFSAGLLSGLITGKGFEDALKLGILNSESVIGATGAIPGLLRGEEALQRLQRYDYPFEKKPL